MRTLARTLVAAFLVMGLVGCSTVATPKPRATATPTMPKVAPKPTPMPVTFSFSCYNAEFESPKLRFATLQEAWASGVELGSCEATKAGTSWTEQQLAAFAASGYEDKESLDTLYTICVMPGMGYASRPTTPYSEGQVKEVTAALIICPTHPAANQVRERIGQAAADSQAEADGTRFGPGVFLVGSEVQAGTYAIEGNISNCYWERQNPAGGIIDNYFTLGAARVEVTIQASDYGFHSTGCGIWTKVG